MNILVIICIVIFIWIMSMGLSIIIDDQCLKLDPHHDEPAWLYTIPIFNIIIHTVFLLIIIVYREK